MIGGTEPNNDSYFFLEGKESLMLGSGPVKGEYVNHGGLENGTLVLSVNDGVCTKKMQMVVVRRSKDGSGRVSRADVYIMERVLREIIETGSYGDHPDYAMNFVCDSGRLSFQEKMVYDDLVARRKYHV